MRFFGSEIRNSWLMDLEYFLDLLDLIRGCSWDIFSFGDGRLRVWLMQGRAV